MIPANVHVLGCFQMGRGEPREAMPSAVVEFFEESARLLSGPKGESSADQEPLTQNENR
jgi:hypothetical protein